MISWIAICIILGCIAVLAMGRLNYRRKQLVETAQIKRKYFAMYNCLGELSEITLRQDYSEADWFLERYKKAAIYGAGYIGRILAYYLKKAGVKDV